MSNLNSLFEKHAAVIVFDCETSGLDADKHQIIELAAIRIERTSTAGLRIASKMDAFIRLPEGEHLAENIVELTGITDELLEREGVQQAKAASQFGRMLREGPIVMAAHNAQFDLQFVRQLLKGQKIARADFLDTLTVYKDRRAYPHKLANAIIAYDLAGKVKNSHRAIDDVIALFEVLKAMDEERDDLATYLNVFGYNPKYGRSGGNLPQEHRAPGADAPGKGKSREDEMTAGGPVRYSISPRTSAAARRRRERERKARRIRRIAFSFTGLTLLTVAIVIVVMAATQNTSHAEVTQTPAPPAASQQQELRALVSTHEASGPEFAADIIVGHKEAPEAEPTEEPEPAAYFQITDAERDTIERVVMAEAGGEPFAGQEAVAQYILNACTRDNIRPDEAVKKYGYTRSRPDPTESVREAVAAVFDSGAKVTTAPILFFYAPARCTSAWHESQQFEIEINGHRFFSEKGD